MRDEREARKATAAAAVQTGGTFGPEPQAADLAVINQRFALAALAPEDVYVRRMVLANDALDRSYERFTPAVLERFAQSLPGKPVLVAHDRRELPIGLVYQAQVRPARPGEAGETSLEAAFYMVKSPENAAVRQQIDGGVVRSVSIGFRYDTRICSVCGLDEADCPHTPGERIEGGTGRGGEGARGRGGDAGIVTYTYGGDLSRYEACECSLVYLGCQQGTELTKGDGGREAVDGSRQTGDGGRGTADGGRQSVDGGRQSGDDSPAKAGSLPSDYCPPSTVHRLPLSDYRPPSPVHRREEEMEQDALDETAALVADGKAYRQYLKEEVRRLAGILKSEAEANLLLKALPHAPAEALKELLENYQRRVEEKFPPRPLGVQEAPDASRQAPVGAGPVRPVVF